MHKKRGQVTAFIILGMLVVASILGVYFARDYVLKSAWERSYEKSLVVPKQAENVKNYIDSCVNDLANRGIDLLGQQGGYIVMPNDPFSDPLDKFSNSLEVLTGFKTPYWYYKANNNVEVIQKPSLNNMEEELAAYVDANIKECLGDFKAFGGYKISTGNSRTEVEIKDDEVLLTTKIPIKIQLKDFKFDIKEFYAKVNAPLGKLYKEASKVYDKENLDNFLERNTINALVLNEEIPVTGITRDCGTKIWARKDVVDAIKKYVPLEIQMLRLKGTNYELIDPAKEEYYELDLGMRDYDIDASLYTSANWPFEIEIIPTEGELLKAESVTRTAGALEGLVQGFFCMNYYQFLYNLKYPVLIILTKEGYTFKFAMQVVVESNEARKSTFNPISVPEVDKTFCNNLQTDLEVYTYDDEGDPISKVDIKYKCINVICDIGETAGNSLKAKFPPCINGAVIANKKGYNRGKVEVSTNEQAVVTVSMARARDIGIDISVTGRTSSSLSGNEKVFISMVNSEDEFSSSIVYPEQKVIKLIPGNYEVYTYVLKETDGFNIPAERKQVCTKVPVKGVAGWFGAKEDKCITVDIPASKIEDVIVGGAKFNMQVNNNDLRKAKIRYYIPYKGIPKSIEDLSMLKLEVDENFVYPKFE